MNERIRELMYQAANGMISYDAEGDWRLSGKEVEKFAELIIRECADVASDYDGAHYVGAAIERHFGVE